MTGLHALDGARYLRDGQHADTMLCRLVAHHSYAIVEADGRGLADILGLEFEPAPYVLSSVVTYCDMTTSPTANSPRSKSDSPRSITATAPSHQVSRSIQRATPIILRAVEHVHGRTDRTA
jgi:hypothetical protein